MKLDATPLRIGAVGVIEKNDIMTPVGKNFIGRVVNVFGEPIDGKGPITPDQDWDVFHSAPPLYARELLASGEGGVGYLLKDRVTSLEEFTDAVERVRAGGTVLDPLVVRQLISSRPDPLSELTRRERDVIELMAEGRSNATIAERLFIGVGAVEKNVTSIFSKLGLEESGSDHRRVLAVLAFLQR